jgi:hypothetical protein
VDLSDAYRFPHNAALSSPNPAWKHGVYDGVRENLGLDQAIGLFWDGDPAATVSASDNMLKQVWYS